MCLTLAFRETRRRARFCNRYVSSSTADGADFTGGNGVAVNAALDALDAFGLVDAFAGRPPHITKVGARIDLQRGEKVADLLAIRAPRTVRRGRRVHVRVAMRRLHGPIVVRRYALRVPRNVPTGRRRLVLSGAGDGGSNQDTLFTGLLTGSSGDGGASGPSTMHELVDSIHALGRADGVDGRIGGRRFAAFRDADVLISGRAETRIRIRR
jgi:hypothetical protein